MAPLTSNLDLQRNHKGIRYGLHKSFGPISEVTSCVTSELRVVYTSTLERGLEVISASFLETYYPHIRNRDLSLSTIIELTQDDLELFNQDSSCIRDGVD